jgi:Ni,Fe-hydrogenase I small subunit
MKYCTVAAGALGLTTTDLLKIDQAFAKIGDGGPHVVWLPGQACTGCLMSFANSVFYETAADVVLDDIDLDYSETLMAASGDEAVAAAVSTIGKTTVLALEGCIPEAKASIVGSSDKFCTVWTRTGGIAAAGSSITNLPAAASDGTLVLSAVTLVGGDIIRAGSELVAGTSLPANTAVPSAADRAAMEALGATFTAAGGTVYGSDVLNTNVTLAADLSITDDVLLLGGTDNGMGGDPLNPIPPNPPINPVQASGSTLAAGTTLATGTIVTNSFDRTWLATSPADVATAATFDFPVSGNDWTINNGPIVLNADRTLSGPITVVATSTIGAGSTLKAGTRVTASADQLAIDPTLAKFGYGSTGGTFVLAAGFSITGSDEIVLTGAVTLDPLSTGGTLGSTPATDKTMLHESVLFGTSAAAILCIGTCSSFGGIPAAAGNRTGASGALYTGYVKAGKFNGAMTQFSSKTINISGCPPHADWIVGTIAYILSTNLQTLPSLEAYNRPVDYYELYQCNAGPCEWRYNEGFNPTDETSYTNPKVDGSNLSSDSKVVGVVTGYGYLPTANATVNSSKHYKYKWENDGNGKRYLGCLGNMGCKGRKTKADCSLRRWNSDAYHKYGSGWCVGSGAGCHGCTEPTFPDKVGKFFNFR